MPELLTQLDDSALEREFAAAHRWCDQTRGRPLDERVAPLGALQRVGEEYRRRGLPLPDWEQLRINEQVRKHQAVLEQERQGDRQVRLW